MKAKNLAWLMIIVLAPGFAITAFAGIPDLYESTVETAYTGPETPSLVSFPNGGGQPFTEAFLPVITLGDPPRTTDMTITLTVRDGGGFPVVYFPFEDMWLQAPDGGLIACSGYGTVADASTDDLGQTTWATSLMAAGYSEAGLEVMISGYAVQSGGVDMKVNSPDINGDGVVNLTDVAFFAGDYMGAYTYRSDFNYDGALDLPDVVFLARAMGATCP